MPPSSDDPVDALTIRWATAAGGPWLPVGRGCRAWGRGRAGRWEGRMRHRATIRNHGPGVAWPEDGGVD
ncbi:hypothetical protein GCM10009733_033970 [Nonomuraea maheshkhaliensis]|uniref:Uncharacterized protein n=1 Tax=Nonomuraea maheshkhaliensis TaxID=419590 RepID=A0ABP4R3J3_9ACTN